MTDEQREERAARRRRLEVDVDARLMRVWARLWELDDPLTPEVMAVALRAAYSEGYTDALREDAEGRRCALSTDNGYAVI